MATPLKHHRPHAHFPERVVVLGKSGFVAASAIERMSSEGIQVVGLGSDDLDLTARDAGEDLAGRLRETDVLLFVSARAPCKTASGLMENLRMAEAVHLALEAKAISQVVYISSDAVYGGGIGPVSEETPNCPDSLHGLMHLAREMMIRQATPSPVCVLRPTLLYGAADPHNGYGPNRFRRQAASGDPIRLFGEGEERRDHVLMDDLAELITLCIVHQSEGLLNIATGASTSFSEVAEKVGALFDEPTTIEPTPRQNPITHVTFDNSAVSDAFPGFRFTDLDEGLRRAHEADSSRP